MYEEAIPVGASVDVGRNPDMTDLKNLRLNDRRISQRHFCVRHDPDSIKIIDLNSRNGTWIDGVECPRWEAPVKLMPAGGVKFFAGDPDRARYYFVLELEPIHKDAPITVRDEVDGTVVDEEQEGEGNQVVKGPRLPPIRRNLDASRPSAGPDGPMQLEDPSAGHQRVNISAPSSPTSVDQPAIREPNHERESTQSSAERQKTSQPAQASADSIQQTSHEAVLDAAAIAASNQSPVCVVESSLIADRAAANSTGANAASIPDDLADVRRDLEQIKDWSDEGFTDRS
jgi:hypothetical protein